MPTMHESLNAFSNRLLQIKGSLDVQKDLFAKKEQDIYAILDNAANRLKSQTQYDNRPEENSLQKAIKDIFIDFSNGIKHWRDEIESRSKVRKKLEEMGTGLIVVVFGRTNAGKSTLGNFLRGKQLRQASFDNAWKNNVIPLQEIKIIDKDKNSEIVDPDDWFKEGSIETTREAQLFQLPGLLWVDTPGFGSTNDDSLGALARKYVKRADMIIYLDHSDNPGLASITQQLVDILQDGRCVLVTINHSDKKELIRENGKVVFGDDGYPLQKTVAKSTSDRELQEKYLSDLLTNLLKKGDTSKNPQQKIDAISISMRLASEAVKNDDDEQYQGSNIHALFSQIMSLIKDESAFLRLKSRDAVQNCLSLIHMVLGTQGSKETITLDALDAKFTVWEEKIAQAEKDFNIDHETGAIIAPIMLKGRDQLRQQIRSIANQSSGDQRRIDINPITDGLVEDAHAGVQQKVRHMLKELWMQNALGITQSFPSIAPVELTRKQEKHVYEVTETESYIRDPDGIIERVCSLFGKEYYGSRLVTRKREQTIDLGFNVEETYAELVKKIESALTEYVKHEMETIRSACLVGGKELLRDSRAVLANVRTQLERVRSELEQQISSC